MYTMDYLIVLRMYGILGLVKRGAEVSEVDVVGKHHHMDEKRTGGRLLELRKERGHSREEVARKLYISKNALKSYEYGIRKPPIDVLKGLCDMFNKENIEELIVWEEEYDE